MTLDEALKAREDALQSGHIDTVAIDRLCELLPGDAVSLNVHAWQASKSGLRSRSDENSV